MKSRRQRKQGVSFAAARKLALALPGVEEGTSYGTPGFKVRGKFLTHLRVEDNSLVFKVGSIEERDFLLKADPGVFFITDHYRDYPAVLVRLATVRPALLKEMFAQSWRRIAPRRLLPS